MTSVANNNLHVAREIKCSICAELGHNMRTCDRLPFRLEQAHQVYLYLWISWFQQINTQLVTVTDYFRYAKIITMQKHNWLKIPINLQLLKTFLKITHIKYTQAIRNYIDGFYHYLVLKKNGILDYVIQNNLPRLAELAELATTNYAHYDYLLESITETRVVNIFNIRQYGIIIERKETLDTATQESCAICYEDYMSTNFVKTNCHHSFCQNCVIETIKILHINNEKLSCAMCRSNINHLSCYTSIITNNLKNVLNI